MSDNSSGGLSGSDLSSPTSTDSESSTGETFVDVSLGLFVVY